MSKTLSDLSHSCLDIEDGYARDAIYTLITHISDAHVLIKQLEERVAELERSNDGN